MHLQPRHYFQPVETFAFVLALWRMKKLDQLGGERLRCAGIHGSSYLQRAARRAHVSDRRLYATAPLSSAAEQLSGHTVCTTGKTGPVLGDLERRRAT
jgi:hypothetical protein